jgi:hypothetical protein
MNKKDSYIVIKSPELLSHLVSIVDEHPVHVYTCQLATGQSSIRACNNLAAAEAGKMPEFMI